MNKPLRPHQLELVPDQADSNKTGNVLAAAGCTPAQIEIVKTIIAEAGTGDDHFDWNAADEAIVVRPRPCIAVYRNRDDDVVIRTQNTSDAYDEDHFAFVRPESLPAVIKALQECLS